MQKKSAYNSRKRTKRGKTGIPEYRNSGMPESQRAKAVGGIAGDGEDIEGAAHAGEIAITAPDVAGDVAIDRHEEDAAGDDLLVIGFPELIRLIVDTCHFELEDTFLFGLGGVVVEVIVLHRTEAPIDEGVIQAHFHLAVRRILAFEHAERTELVLLVAELLQEESVVGIFIGVYMRHVCPQIHDIPTRSADRERVDISDRRDGGGRRRIEIVVLGGDGIGLTHLPSHVERGVGIRREIGRIQFAGQHHFVRSVRDSDLAERDELAFDDRGQFDIAIDRYIERVALMDQHDGSTGGIDPALEDERGLFGCFVLTSDEEQGSAYYVEDLFH